MIKAVIFDNNGVLTTGNVKGPFPKVAKFFGISPDKLKIFWSKGSKKLDRGKITIDKFLKDLIKEIDPKKDFQKLQEIYYSCYKPKKEVRNFAKKLSKNYEVALLTNFGNAFKKYNKIWELDRIFPKDKIFVSYVLKMIKPHRQIYKYVLKKLRRRPEETIFIDDNKKYIEGAKKAGMNTILFKSLPQLKKDLSKYIKI